MFVKEVYLMKKVTRIIAAVLSLMMLTCAFVSCGEDTANYEKIFVYKFDPDDPRDKTPDNFVNVTNDEELLAAINYLRNNHPSEVLGRKNYGKDFDMWIYFNDDIDVQLEAKTEEFRDYIKNRSYYMRDLRNDDGTIEEYYVSLGLPENEDDGYYAEWLKSLSENEKIKKVYILYSYWVVTPADV